MRGTSRASVGVVTLLVAMLAWAAPAWSQSTATLQGTVTDSQGAVMPGVSITFAMPPPASSARPSPMRPASTSRPRSRPATTESSRTSRASRIRRGRSISTSRRPSPLNVKLGVAVVGRNGDRGGRGAAHRNRDRVGRPGDGRADGAGDSAERPALRGPRPADARRRDAAAERGPDRAAARPGRRSRSTRRATAKTPSTS